MAIKAFVCCKYFSLPVAISSGPASIIVRGGLLIFSISNCELNWGKIAQTPECHSRLDRELKNIDKSLWFQGAAIEYNNCYIIIRQSFFQTLPDNFLFLFIPFSPDFFLKFAIYNFPLLYRVGILFGITYAMNRITFIIF